MKGKNEMERQMQIKESKEDGTTLSFSDKTIVDVSFDELRNKILETLKKYGIAVNVTTMELPQKMEIYYYSDYKKWLVNISFDEVSPKQSIWLSEPKDEHKVCKAIEKILGIKFKSLNHGYAQTGIDIWKTERDYSKEVELSHKKEQQSEKKNMHSNVTQYNNKQIVNKKNVMD